jgi:hypothetical protein
MSQPTFQQGLTTRAPLRNGGKKMRRRCALRKKAERLSRGVITDQL